MSPNRSLVDLALNRTDFYVGRGWAQSDESGRFETAEPNTWQCLGQP